MSHIKIEIWNTIVGFGNFYEASNFGRIRSKDRVVKKMHRSAGRVVDFFYKGKVLKQFSDSSGYLHVHIGVDGVKYNARVNRLVAIAFLGPPPSIKHFVLHGNDNPSDNRPENLRWGTHLDNMQDRKSAGNYKCGENHAMAKLNDEKAMAIQSGVVGLKEAMSRYGISRTTFYRTKNKETMFLQSTTTR